MINVEIGRNEQNQRLDKFLKKYLGNAPLSYIYKAIRKDIKVNGKRAKEDTMLALGDTVTFYISDSDFEKFRKVRRISSAKRQFSIAYEDENIIAVEKPFGLLTHGDKTEKKNHLANQVIDYLIETGSYVPRLEKTFVPAPVNRLDRNTTGLVLFGKTNTALQQLNEMMRTKDNIEKYYLTIVSGQLRKDMHLVDNIAKDEVRNTISILAEGEEGKRMETIVHPLKVYGRYTLVQVQIITGRTHQIRAHLANTGHPIIGDAKYGDRRVNQVVKKKFGLTTQLLHAHRLVFGTMTGELSYLSGMEIVSEPPAAFTKIRESIESN